MDTSSIMEARWTLLQVVLGPDISALLAKGSAVEAIPRLAASARQWLLTEAPRDSSDRALAEQEITDLEVLAVAIDFTRRHGRGWDALTACHELGLTLDLPTLPKLTRAQERHVHAINSKARSLASLAVAVRTGDTGRIKRAHAYVALCNSDIDA